MHTLLTVHWDKEFDDLEHQIGFDMEASKFIEAGEMEEDKEYYGINFFPLDSCTEYLKECSGIDCFIEYPDLVKKEITRQTTFPKATTKTELFNTLNWKYPQYGQFIIVLDYNPWKDEWAGDYDESIDVIGVLGVDCEIKPINRDFAAEKKRFEDKAELQKVCKHELGTYTECTDYHRRDFGTFCKECDKLLSDNG